MKRFLQLLAILCASMTLFTLSSCGGEEDEILIDEDDQINYSVKIVGTWQMSGTQEYWRFDRNGYGENWDLADDVNEGEGNDFKWSFEKNGLMVIYKLNGSYSDPEPDAPFIINTITDYRMIWTTNNGKGSEQSFSKVK